MQRIFFISGLPRAGSTLLSAVLRQNPALHADMSSPLYSMVMSLQRDLSRGNQFSIDVTPDTRRRVLRGLFESYYAPFAGRTVFDTNRAWTMKLGVLLDLFPDAKLVCCVRPVLQIIESFERVFRENRLEANAMLGFDPDLNVYGRVDRLMVPNGVIGVALNALKDAFYGLDSDRLLLVGYDKLVTRPAATLEAIYDFIGEPRFAHDFDNLAFEAPAFDASFGLTGLHTIRQKVAAQAQRATLPPDLSGMFRAPEFWTAPTDLSRASRIT